MTVINSADTQIWLAAQSGGGDAIVNVDGDSTVGGGDVGYNLMLRLEDDPNLHAPRDIVVDTVHDRFWFVDSDIAGNNRIYQGSISQVLANPGAPVLTVLYENSGSSPDDSIRTLSVDMDNGIVYFDVGTTFNKVVADTPLQTPTQLADLGFGNYITQVAIDYERGNVFLGSSSVSSFFGMDFVTTNYIFTASGLTPTSTSLTFSELPFDEDDSNFGDPDIFPVPGEAFPAERGTIRGLDIDQATGTLYITTGTVNLDTSTDQDGSEIQTFWGGVYSYETVGNPTGAYDALFVQDGTNGPVGLLYYIDVDASTGRYFLVDETGSAAADDGGIWVGDLTGGTPTLFQTIGDGRIPQGLDVLVAPTISGTDAGDSAVETAGAGSGFSSGAQGLTAIAALDGDSALLVDQLAGARVRISEGFGSSPGSAERLTINGTPAGIFVSGTESINYSYDSMTGVMTLSGASTFDAYEAALAAVEYSISGDDPTNGGASTTRSLAYALHDGLLYSDEQEVEINIVATNDDPTASATNMVSTAEDTPSAATAIGAADVDSTTLTYSEKVGFEAANGSVTFDQINGTFTYTPNPDFNGSDSFTILIEDGDGGSAEQVVAVTVTPVNDDPTAPPTNSVTTDEDTPSAATAINADDVDDDVLTYSEKVGFEAANGTVTFDQLNGTFTYIPDLDFVGSDGFTILIDDGNGGTAEQVVSVTVENLNDPPSGVTGDLAADEDGVNGTLAGTLTAQDSDSSSHSFVLLDDAGGRFTMDSSGNVYIADGLLLDYEQASSHTIRVEVTDDEGASSEFDVEVEVVDVLGEDVQGDGRDNIFFGGAEADVLVGNDGNDTLVGQGGQDTLNGGNGNDTIDGGADNDTINGNAGNDVINGGAGQDVMTGGAGEDVFVFHKGEANGDKIIDYWGQGASIEDSIVLVGYGEGTTFTRVGGGSSTTWAINDNGYIEYVTVIATGQVHPTDVTYLP